MSNRSYVIVAAGIGLLTIASTLFIGPARGALSFVSASQQENFRDEVCWETKRLDENGDPIERCINVGFVNPDAALNNFESDIEDVTPDYSYNTQTGEWGDIDKSCPTGDTFCQMQNAYDAGGRDTDKDGVPDAVDQKYDPPQDSDGDGVKDIDELDGALDTVDTDKDGRPDSQDDDIDGDGATNFEDIDPFGLTTDLADTKTGRNGDADGDGIANGNDIFPNLPKNSLPDDFYKDPQKYLAPGSQELYDDLLNKAFAAYSAFQEELGKDVPATPPPSNTEEGKDFTDFVSKNYSDKDNVPPSPGEENFDEYLQYQEQGQPPADPANPPSAFKRFLEKIKTFFKNLFSTEKERKADAIEDILDNDETYDDFMTFLKLEEDGFVQPQSGKLDKFKAWLKKVGLSIKDFVKGKFSSDAELREDEIDDLLAGGNFDDYLKLLEQEKLKPSDEPPLSFSDWLKSKIPDNKNPYKYDGIGTQMIDKIMDELGAVPLPDLNIAPNPENINLPDMYDDLAKLWDAYEKEQKNNLGQVTNPYVYSNSDLPNGGEGYSGQSSLARTSKYAEPGQLQLVNLNTGAILQTENYYNTDDLMARWAELYQQYGNTNPSTAGWQWKKGDRTYRDPNAYVARMEFIKQQHEGRQ